MSTGVKCLGANASNATSSARGSTNNPAQHQLLGPACAFTLPHGRKKPRWLCIAVSAIASFGKAGAFTQLKPHTQGYGSADANKLSRSLELAMGESQLAEMEPTHGTGGPARPMAQALHHGLSRQTQRSGAVLGTWGRAGANNPAPARVSWHCGLGESTASTGCPHICGSSTLTRAVHPTCNSVKSTKIELVEVSSFLKPPFQIQLVFYRMLVSWMRHTEDKISQSITLTLPHYNHNIINAQTPKWGKKT